MRRAAERATVVILAGGAGTRVGGRDKGLVPYRGRPLIEHAIARLAGHDLVVAAHRNLDEYARYAPVVADAHAAFLGPLAGIAAAFAHLRGGRAITLPVDVVDYDEALVDALDDALASGSDACVVTHDGTHRQPLFAAYDVARASPVAQERLAARKLSVRDFQDALGARELVVPGRYENLNTMDHYA